MNIQHPEHIAYMLGIAGALTWVFNLLFHSRKRVKVERVWDGDTFMIYVRRWPWLWVLRKQNLRLRGMDAPEMKQTHGSESRKALCELIENKVIEIKFLDNAKGDRLACWAWVNGINVSENMIANGHAWNYAQYGGVFQKQEENARRKKLGLWKYSNPTAPWDFRHGTVTKLEPLKKESFWGRVFQFSLWKSKPKAKVVKMPVKKKVKRK